MNCPYCGNPIVIISVHLRECGCRYWWFDHIAEDGFKKHTDEK